MSKPHRDVSLGPPDEDQRGTAAKRRKKQGKKFFVSNGFKPTRAVSRVKKGWETLCPSGFDDTALCLFLFCAFCAFLRLFFLRVFNAFGTENLPPTPTHQRTND